MQGSQHKGECLHQGPILLPRQPRLLGGETSSPSTWTRALAFAVLFVFKQ